jgi:positive regulator of sigma E activity
MIQGWLWTWACYALVIFFLDMFFLKSMITKAVFKNLGNLLGIGQGFSKAIKSRKKKKKKDGNQKITINVNVDGVSQDGTTTTVDDE